MGESVAISRLSEVLDIEEDTLKELLEEMKGDYAGKDRGICLIELDGAYQICTKIETYEYRQKVSKSAEEAFFNRRYVRDTFYPLPINSL